MAKPNVKIGVIGGSGLYQLGKEFPIIEEVYPLTPWGYPSDKILIIEMIPNIQIAFLARHGKNHRYSPSELPYRANLAALKHLGVEIVLAFSAVGSLREQIQPGDFVLPNQCIDFTKGIRPSTYFENGIIAHIPFSFPFSNLLLTELFSIFERHFPKHTIHTNQCLICIEGPQFSTQAESLLFRQWNADIINMTILPESKLAKELELLYQPICMVTDYDSWKLDLDDHVNVPEVMATMVKNSLLANEFLAFSLAEISSLLLKHPHLSLRGSTKPCIMGNPDDFPSDQRKKLNYIFPEYFPID